MKKTSLLLTIFTLLLFTASIAQAGVLGPAADYSLFIFDTVTVSGSDSRGPIAAGGDISIENYYIGGSGDLSDYRIVGGSNVSFGPGTVNGSIFANGDLSLTNYSVHGDVTANGSISYFNGGTLGGTATSNAGVATPIDFDQAYIDLSSASASLSGMEVNGITDVQYGSNLYFTGTEDINVFSLTDDDFKDVTNINFNIADDAVAIINVSGIDYFPSLGINGASGNELNILWNFYGATDLSLNGTIYGSILAPDADVNFNNGNFYGTLVANSMTGGEQLYPRPFEHDILMVPEPISSTLFLVGGVALGFRRLKLRIIPPQIYIPGNHN